MVDTTDTNGSGVSPQPLSAAAGAPENKITPAMVEAGEDVIFAFGVTPNLSTGDWASDLANQVYRAMERAR